MKDIKKNICVVIISVIALVSCNEENNKEEKLIKNFDEIGVILMGKNDTVKINNKNEIEKIVNFMNQGELYPSKISFKYCLYSCLKDSCDRIGLKKNKLSFRGKNYLLKIDLEEYLEKEILN
ncbi:hypothetical protein [uncultured Aquimarina sp.]|uniref:hypothetical protein n=1 Tax=uncultured Aquimarina sp. TaxID=575652 RepID=UPI0026284B9F|nr:hypothetical protein [uncultured Aquimarina sp.]